MWFLPMSKERSISSNCWHENEQTFLNSNISQRRNDSQLPVQTAVNTGTNITYTLLVLMSWFVGIDYDERKGGNNKRSLPCVKVVGKDAMCQNRDVENGHMAYLGFLY